VEPDWPYLVALFLALVVHIILYDLLLWQPYRRLFRNTMAWLIRHARRLWRGQ